MIRQWIYASILASALAVLAEWRTAGFSPARCQVQLLQSADAPSLAIQWPKRFHYLSRGKQAFAFVSEDGRFVLKFFDLRNLQARWYAPFVKPKARWAKWRALYPESYRIAEKYLPQETGVLLVHLGCSAARYPTVEVVDQASRCWQIDLNETPFVLQKKGESTLLDRLRAARRDPAELRRRIEQYLAFHKKRISLGIADRDRDIKHNYVWDGDELLYIDPAQFTLEPDSAEQSWNGAITPLRRWLMREAPEALPWFESTTQ